MPTGLHRVIVGLQCAILCLFALSAPALSEDVKFSDLEGMVVEARFTRDQIHRSDGKTISVKMNGDWKIAIKSEQQGDFTYKVTAHTQRGKREAQPLSGTFTLDERREVSTRGRGQAIWKFADGTLTFMRTMEEGAYRFDFSFAGSGNGMTCTVKECPSSEFLRQRAVPIKGGSGSFSG